MKMLHDRLQLPPRQYRVAKMRALNKLKALPHWNTLSEEQCEKEEADTIAAVEAKLEYRVKKLTEEWNGRKEKKQKSNASEKMPIDDDDRDSSGSDEFSS
jgi:hypothetical protein